MSIPSRPGGFERFKEREDVAATLSSINDSASSLHQALSDASPDYDSSVIFSYIDGQAVANPLVTLEASDSLWYRHRYRRENIEDSLVVLSGTTLGKNARDKNFDGFATSAINKEMPQVVHGERLIHDDKIVGIMQRSFTPSGRDGALEFLPGNDEIDRIDSDHRQDLARTAANVALLQTMAEGHGSLGLLLEQQQAIAPDACWVRIDVVGSSNYALGSQQVAYDAYQNQCQIFFKELIKDYEDNYLVEQFGIKTGFSDQGDGAYLMFPIPEAYNPYDQRTLEYYQHYSIEPFLRDLQAGLDAIALQYKSDLSPIPRVTINSALGNTHINGRGRYISPVLTQLARNKEK